MKRTFPVAALLCACLFTVAACRAGRPAAVPAGVSPAEIGASVPRLDPDRLHVVLVNGGGRREINYQSHLIHLKQIVELLRATGVSASHVTIFSSDGADPAADLATRDRVEDPRLWLLPLGDAAGSARPDIVYVDSKIDGFTLQPARKDTIRTWFTTTGKTLQDGDTLLFYVTDHGERNAKDLTNNTISLWKEDLSVTELRQLFSQLDPAVRVVQVMSQCFSGAFARTIYSGDGMGTPSGNVCGYYSVTADRPAYGCYPENRGKDGIGYSHHLFEALDVLGTLPEANKRIQVTDRSPDVPFVTSNFYLEQLLQAAAETAKQDQTVFIDALLAQAWKDRAAWEPQIRLLDRIGRTFGTFSPRSLKELQAESEALPDFSTQLRTYGQRWSEALEALKYENWHHFLDAQPQWRDKFDPKKRTALEAKDREQLMHEVLAALEPFTKHETVRYDRLVSLREKADDATGASYRTDVRLGAVLRMRSILTTVAGQTYLATHGSNEERDTYQHLVACEALALGPPPTVLSAAALPAPEPFPTLADERSLVERVMPAWMGIQYKPLPDTQRKQHHVEKGAVAVTTVFPDSAAATAGLQVGDVILGPPNMPFTEPHAVREWTMRSEIGQPTPLRVLREQQTLQITLRPSAFPVKMPKLPGPPPVGSNAPQLKLDMFRGGERVVAGKAKLLFFWATWCVPCKYALPEVMAFAKSRGIEIVTVTDEDPEVLTKFFAGHHDPFPEVVAIDPLRITFQSYGVSGTPTIVLIDDHDIVTHYQTGYNAEHGLNIDGWNWTPPNKKAAQPAPKTGG